MSLLYKLYTRIKDTQIRLFGFDIISRENLYDFRLHNYDSYEDYKKTQELANKKKINLVWADTRTLKRVAKIVLNNTSKKNYLGLCHGTRNGFEQNFLNENFKEIKAIGTDISKTAKNFKNSYVWDFHDTKDSWVNKFDFVYTNSLDHSYNPKKAIATWLEQVKKHGLVIIEHTEAHNVTNKVDPFGVDKKILPFYITLWFEDKILLTHTTEKKLNSNYNATLFVLKKLI